MSIESILLKEELNKEEIIKLLSIQGSRNLNKLFRKADEVRRQYCGDEVYLRGIIEISNYCEQNCLYCGLRKFNGSLVRYRMTMQEILDTARAVHRSGIRTIVLQSGEDPFFTGNDIEVLIKTIKAETRAAITLSLGERSFDDYVLWKKAGADRYLLKHETANADLYFTIHQKQFLKERLDHILFLISSGYQTGSGNIIGIPKQSIEDIADDILLCRKMNIDMASFSPFISSPDSPLRSSKNGNVELVLKTIAAARIVLKNVHMPATTALSTLDPDGRRKALCVGANVIMPNFTPVKYRVNYKIYPGKYMEDPAAAMISIKKMLLNMGRRISTGRGDSLVIR